LDRLQQLLNNLDIIQSTHPEDACIVLADTEKVIGYVPGKSIDLKIPIGASAENFQGTVTYSALQSGKALKEERGSETFGIAYISTATPIIENNEVIGVITAIVSNNKVDVLRKGAQGLTTISEKLSTNSDEITRITGSITTDLKNLTQESMILRNDIKQVEDILSIIKNTSVKSRILGLNASIEAARSGENGKGFAVVANEIKKMADNSKESVESVEPQLKEMITNIEKIISTIQLISTHSGQQSAMLEGFYESFEQIVKTASQLRDQTI
jgi:hypothetical protein